MAPSVTEVGVGAAVAIYIIKTVFDFVLKMVNKPKASAKMADNTNAHTVINDKLAKIAAQVHDLHEWHNVKDNDHVFSWYIRDSLTKTIEELNTNVERLAAAALTLTSERKKR